MIIIGCDYHPGVQQIAWVDTDTGEFQETRLQHREQAEKFYGELAIRGVRVRLGMEASGQARWFERLLAELQMELWIGDAAEIRARRVRKKKTDREDARHILRLLVEDRPGVLADICRTLADEQVSISSVIQHEALDGEEGGIVPLVILTHTAVTGHFRAAAERIGKLSGVTAPSVYYSVAD